MKKLLFGFIFFFISFINLAQKENTHWYFGNGAGLKFTNELPVSLQNSDMFTEEGSASVSDSDGNLIFYTDGVTVWDKTHNPTPNGKNLAGHKSSTQAAVIIPNSANKNQYYIFTTDEKGGLNGLNYSIFDVTKNNGLGDVTIKNSRLLFPVCEKLTVAKHQNQKDFWIIVHNWNSDVFSAFLVTEKGVIRAPVTSKVGSVHKDVGTNNNGESIGQMKVSHQFNRIALAITYKANQPIELFDFDNATGLVSNMTTIPTPGFAYGIEFSPDNSKLYVSFLKGEESVVQYDLSSPDIPNSKHVLAYGKEMITYGSLQLAPDNRIYVAKTGKFIDVINQPNLKGNASQYELGGVNLKDRSCVFGLPAITYASAQFNNEEISVKMEPEKPKDIPKPKSVKNMMCNEFVELDAGVSGKVYLWSTGETTQKIKVYVPGNYDVKISKPDNISSETASFVVSDGKPKVFLGNDTVLNCVASIKLDAKNRGFEYHWSTGSRKQIIEVDESGIYSVTVTNGNCRAEDEIRVTFNGTPAIFKALTTFSPENKGFNSLFDFSIIGITDFELTVFNAKNKVIFKTNNKEEKWRGYNSKGEREPNGDYKWSVKYIGPCTEGKYITREGVVRLY
jgi:hypothetical protein